MLILRRSYPDYQDAERDRFWSVYDEGVLVGVVNLTKGAGSDEYWHWVIQLRVGGIPTGTSGRAATIEDARGHFRTAYERARVYIGEPAYEFHCDALARGRFGLDPEAEERIRARAIERGGWMVRMPGFVGAKESA